MKKYFVILILVSFAAVSCGETEDLGAPSPLPDNFEYPTGEPDDEEEEEEEEEETQGVNMWAIDMTPLEIDGKYYAVWSGWDKYYENREGTGQYLYIAEMTFHDQAPKVRLGERVLLSSPEKSWELAQGENFSLLEGPEILKHDNDVFIIYSTRGSWTVHYKMGQLRLTDRSAPLNPASWTKKETPVFTGVTSADGLGYEVYGAGHASFTTSPDDMEYWINYHSKTLPEGGWDDRKVFFKKFVFDANGDPDFGIAPDMSVPQTRPSGETAIDSSFGIAGGSPTFLNPVREGADPWIVKHDGKYYTCRSIQRGIWVTESPYMTKFVDDAGTEITWEQARKKVWTPPALTSDKWNVAQHWAPELHYINGNWYIFYAAGRQQSAPYWQHRAGVLISTSGSPFGPYEEHDTQPLFTGEKES